MKLRDRIFLALVGAGFALFIMWRVLVHLGENLRETPW